MSSRSTPARRVDLSQSLDPRAVASFLDDRGTSSDWSRDDLSQSSSQRGGSTARSESVRSDLIYDLSTMWAGSGGGGGGGAHHVRTSTSHALHARQPSPLRSPPRPARPPPPRHRSNGATGSGGGGGNSFAYHQQQAAEMMHFRHHPDNGHAPPPAAAPYHHRASAPPHHHQPTHHQNPSPHYPQQQPQQQPPPREPDMFLDMLRAIEQRYGALPKAVRIRVERWVAKLAYQVDNATLTNERNMYTAALLHAVTNNKFREVKRGL